MVRVRGQEPVHSRGARAHLPDDDDRGCDVALRQARVGSPCAAQCMPLADGRGQLAIGHRVAQRIEFGFAAQAGAQAFEAQAEVGNFCLAAARMFILRGKTAAAHLPEIFGVERRLGGDALAPQRAHRAVGPIGGAGGGQRMGARRHGHRAQEASAVSSRPAMLFGATCCQLRRSQWATSSQSRSARLRMTPIHPLAP